MIDTLLSLIAPHHCVGCNQEGRLLCDPCQQDVVNAANPTCYRCYLPADRSYLCTTCRTTDFLDELWAVGDYDDVIKRLITLYKFERAKAASQAVGQLMINSLPHIFTTAIVVNIPTIAPHIRQRGYDHTKLLASYIATQRSLRYLPLLKRTGTSSQIGKSRTRRLSQASSFFDVARPVPLGSPILLIDDVVTTGATMSSAAKMLKKAGASHVFGLVCAYDRLNKLQ